MGRGRGYIPGRLCLQQPNRLPEFFDKNPDQAVSDYGSESGMYEPGCGLRQVLMSWGHDEYLFHVMKDYLQSLPST